MTRTRRWCGRVAVALACAGLAGAVQAQRLEIESFNGTGRLSFGELPDATSYQVEWAPTPAGPWTNTWAGLAEIASLGQGSVTCSVPMCYRVVAKLLPAAPTSFSLAGGGATSTVSTVTLDHAYTGRPTYYLVSEDAGFAGASWQAWAGSPAYTLSAGDGVKTVYLKLRNAAGEESAAISDTITLSVPVTVTAFALDDGAASTDSRSVTLNNACSGTPAYYLASEDAGFADASWQAWAGSPAYTLSAGDGVKTVYFRVCNALGALSAAASDTITYTEPVPPSLTQQPQSATNYVGSNVTFSVTAAGTAPLAYQWQFYGTNLAGATGSGLALTNLQTADAGNYRALISNAYGSVTSEVAVLTVLTNAVPPVTEGDYLVVDLSGGPSATNYPVSYLAAVPGGGWTDEHKTTKLVLRRIPATEPDFTMGSPSGELGRRTEETQHAVTLSQGLYVCVFEVTQKQWERVTDAWPSYFNNAIYRDARPVERVSYNAIRGSSAGAGWPANSGVDATSFLGKLRARTGLAFDLPTESQWEYACRAGTTTALNSGYNLTNTTSDARMAEVGRYWYNGGSGYTQGGDTSVGSAKVGSYLPNAWGLYDMHGNVFEWCLDWHGTYPGAVSDPKGASSGSHRCLRSGGWYPAASDCRSAQRSSGVPDYATNYGIGFRLALPPGQQ